MSPLPQERYDQAIAFLKAHRVALVALVITTGIAWWLCGWSGDGVNRAPLALAILVTDGAWALLWLASAAGLGGALAAWLVPDTRGGVPLEAALGVAALLVADAVLGRVGLLATPVGAWATLAPGLALLAWRIGRLLREGQARVGDLPALLLAATPPLAVLLVAACAAPGWLWASEFGGYDALSYHLELPRAWHAAGVIRGPEYNVYGFLPSYVEGAYAHLFALRGGEPEAVLSCQLLHVGLTVLAAAVTGRVATIVAGATAGRVAAVMVLGTPWIAVVGSLAYDEMAVLLLGGGALLLVLDPDAGADRLRTGAAIGLLLGAACGAKLTAAGLVAAPIGGLLLFGAPWRRAAKVAAVAALVAVATLAPYLAGNTLQTGNPVFPFATRVFGTGHWTKTQAAIWQHAHASHLGPAARLAEGLGQLTRDDARDTPAAGRVHRTSQWSVLPWLALVGVAITCLARETRGAGVRLAAVLVVQVVVWLAFTHIKSRFLLPAVVPAAAAIGVAVAVTTQGFVAPVTRQVVTATVAILLTIFAHLPVTRFVSERGGAPAAAIDAIDLMTGATHATRLARPYLSPDERAALRDTAPPAWWVNDALPAGARVLGVGEATALYYASDRFAYQTTWDRGPLSAAMHETDDPAAWMDSLRAAGFTHVLVNETMLAIWEREGWNDPLVTVDRVRRAFDGHARPVRRWPYGVTLYALESSS